MPLACPEKRASRKSGLTAAAPKRARRFHTASGALPDPRDNIGESPLHLAAQLGHVSTITRLLDAGAPVDAASSAGYQPLHLAAEHGRADAARHTCIIMACG